MDVTEANFNAAVIERSHQLPVIVDFWAEWCGPCRQLGPVLERAVAARAPNVELVKLDTDANQNLARAFRIQSIPAVKAFRDGRVVSEFAGAIPPPQIEAFLDALLPSEADELVDAGDEASLLAALELDRTRADAAVPYARLLHARGDHAAALEVLAQVTGDFTADGLTARIGLEADPALPTPVGDAFALLDEGETARALELLLTAFSAASGDRDDLRKVIVGVLVELGPDSELARTARRRLAAALY